MDESEKLLKTGRFAIEDFCVNDWRLKKEEEEDICVNDSLILKKKQEDLMCKWKSLL